MKLKLTGTFLQPLSGGDTPVMSWSRREWDREFRLMRDLGIDTVILLRISLDGWMAYDSEYLRKADHGLPSATDYLDLFLDLAETYHMRMFVPTFSPWHDWLLASYDPEKEFEFFRPLTDEIWSRYGNRKAFGGWYFAQEISGGDSFLVTELFQKLGRYVKEISGNLPVMISPGMRGIKAFPDDWPMEKKQAHLIPPEQHRAEWDPLMEKCKGAVDIIAFQDGHVDFHLLSSYLKINVELARKHGIEIWDNIESFDREIIPKFQPITWDKLRFKLEAALPAKFDKLITYEFTPFLSPNGCYSAWTTSLLERYREWCKLQEK